MQPLLKVLIGDESVPFGQEMRRLLSENDAEVMLTPKDSAKVLQAAADFKPDVVVLEAYMTHGDAPSALRELNAMPNPPKTVVVSGYSNRFLEQELNDLGVSLFLLRPFGLPALCESVLDLCGIARGLPVDINHPGRGTNDLESIVTELILHIGIPAHIKLSLRPPRDHRKRGRPGDDELRYQGALSDHRKGISDHILAR